MSPGSIKLLQMHLLEHTCGNVYAYVERLSKKIFKALSN